MVSFGDLAVGVVLLDVEVELGQVHEPQFAERALVDVRHGTEPRTTADRMLVSG